MKQQLDGQKWQIAEIGSKIPKIIDRYGLKGQRRKKRSQSKFRHRRHFQTIVTNGVGKDADYKSEEY